MSILTSELICYGAASRPTDDASTSGGAIDATMRPVFTQFGAGAKVSLTSSAADTRNVTITGRNAAGEYTTEVVALTGATEVLSVNTYSRVLSVAAATTSGTLTVTVKQGSGGTSIGTIPINEAGFYALFVNSASDPAVQKIRYEKIFWKNTNASLTLTSSTLKLTADPAAKIRIGVAAALDGSTSVAARTTSPGVTFADDNIAQNVPNSGNLTSGSAIGLWIEETLAIGDAPVSLANANFTTQLTGNSV